MEDLFNVEVGPTNYRMTCIHCRADFTVKEFEKEKLLKYGHENGYCPLCEIE